MDFAEQLRVLQAAQGDPAKLALATVDLAYPALPEAERAALKETLEAASIPHWCDETILAALLEIAPDESARRLAKLRGLTVVEEFRARGLNAANVHETARRALRQRLAKDQTERFRLLSARAARLFEADNSPAGRIEWIYHRLCAEPEGGAAELAKLDREWSPTARPEDRSALALALNELEDCRLVTGRARAWVLLMVGWNRCSRGEEAQLQDLAIQALELARQSNDSEAEADSQCLLGDVLVAQGKLAEAQAAFGEDLRISRQLAAQDPSNAGWQRDLAVAHSRVGGVLEAQGKLSEAQAAFGESMQIFRRLAELDPSNTDWQRDLAVAHNKVGGVLEAQGKLAEAQAAFGEGLRISRQLAAQDPSNAGWQRDLAVAHNKVGDVLAAQGKLSEAQGAFGETLAIFRRLAAQDPSNAGWQRELAVACVRLARMQLNSGQATAALPFYEEADTILNRLVQIAPDQAQWKQELRVVAEELRQVRQAVSQQARPRDPGREPPSAAAR